MNKCASLYITLMATLSLALSAQNIASEPEHLEEEEPEHKHMISVMLSHAHISKGHKDGDAKWLTLPAWVINYNYLINHQWAVGLHTDIIIEEFQVKDNRAEGDETTIHRSFPVAIVGAASYKPVHYLALIVGFGAEVEPEETFSLVRLGIEPSITLSEKWEMVFSTVYDIKIKAYNDWNVGVGVARLF